MSHPILRATDARVAAICSIKSWVLISPSAFGDSVSALAAIGCTGGVGSFFASPTLARLMCFSVTCVKFHLLHTLHQYQVLPSAVLVLGFPFSGVSVWSNPFPLVLIRFADCFGVFGAFLGSFLWDNCCFCVLDLHNSNKLHHFR